MCANAISSRGNWWTRDFWRLGWWQFYAYDPCLCIHSKLILRLCKGLHRADCPVASILAPLRLCHPLTCAVCFHRASLDQFSEIGLEENICILIVSEREMPRRTVIQVEEAPDLQAGGGEAASRAQSSSTSATLRSGLWQGLGDSAALQEKVQDARQRISMSVWWIRAMHNLCQ